MTPPTEPTGLRCQFVERETCGESESHWKHGSGPGNGLMRHTFLNSPPTEPTGLREALEVLVEAAEQVPYHRNPNVAAGEPGGYPMEGHREYSCPLCLALTGALSALASPEPSGDVDAAWEALRVDLIGEKDTVSTIVFRHRPLIEAAIERRALTRYAIRTVGEASEQGEVGERLDRPGNRANLDTEAPDVHL